MTANNTNKSLYTYGLLLRRENRYGTEYVTAEVVRRTGDADVITGCDSEGECQYDQRTPTKHWNHLYDGLALQGFVSDFGECDFLAFKPAYYNRHSTDLRTAERAVSTLRSVAKRIEAEAAREPGDILAAICRALRLTFVATITGPKDRSYDQSKFTFWSVEDGRDLLRNIIAGAVHDVRVRLGKAA